MRIKRRISAAALAVLLISAGLLAWQFPKWSGAAFQEDDAVHIDPDKIEESTLIIGTHLIYLGALTDKLYETAIQSSEESGQNTMYYKSEIGEGRWYAIDDAGSIKDISDKGKETGKSKIKELYLTHHTKSDGYTYKLKDNKMVNVYDINSPYDLEGMKELSALVNEKKMSGKGGEVFGAKVEGKVTKWCDKGLDILNKEYIRLKAAGADADWLDMLDRAMGKVDDLRRHEAYQKVEAEVQKLIDTADSADAGYVDALSDAAAQLNDSITETEGNMLDIDSKTDIPDEPGGEPDEPDEPAEEEEQPLTVMTAMESDLIRQYIEEPKDDILENMTTLSHIMEGISVYPEEEAQFLKEKLIPAAEAAYAEDPTEVRKNELDYYKNELASREGGTPASDKELAGLYDKKAKLQQDRLMALDEENLAEAKRLEALIDVTSREIQDKEDAIEMETASLTRQKTELNKERDGAKTEEEKTKLANEIQKLDNQITALGANVDDGSASRKIEEMAEAARVALDEGEDGTARLTDAVEGIGALCGTNPELAGSSLESLYEKMASRKYMDETDIYDGLLEDIEGILADNISVLGQELGEEEAVQVMEEAAGKDKTAAVMGLSMFLEQTSGSGLKNLLDGKVKAYAQEGEAYAFPKLSGTAGTGYAPADVVADYASFRYVWNDNKKRAVLASRKTYYKFTAFDTAVIRGPEEEEEKLGAAAGYKGTVYIPEDYVKKEFGCEVYDIPDTGYCILIDQDIADKAAEVCDALLEKGE